ncbi:MAG: flavin reductase family protein [Anaerovoracaceae bacterium]
MGKVSFKPGTLLSPLPVVMASCGDKPENYNIITIAWTGIINSEPPMTYVSVRKSRHSHNLISETGEFVINLCSEELAFATDYCGVKSGRDIDKFKEQKLTPVKGELVSAPLIAEAPVNLECKVTRVIELPTHDMFMAEIVRVHVNEEFVNENNKILMEKMNLVCYSHGEYYGMKRRPLGKFGYSVMKPKTRRRINREIAEQKKAEKKGKFKKGGKHAKKNK